LELLFLPQWLFIKSGKNYVVYTKWRRESLTTFLLYNYMTLYRNWSRWTRARWQNHRNIQCPFQQKDPGTAITFDIPFSSTCWRNMQVSKGNCRCLVCFD
jgi:hypothetical protein